MQRLNIWEQRQIFANYNILCIMSEREIHNRLKCLRIKNENGMKLNMASVSPRDEFSNRTKP